MLWLNQECGCQKLDLEPGARDRVGPPLLQPLGLGLVVRVGLDLVLVLSSCEGRCYPLDLSLPHVPFLWPQAADTPAQVPPPPPPQPHLFSAHLFAEPVEGGRLGEPAAF